MMYLVEGVKIIFRFTYAILKVNKSFIKKCQSPSELLAALKKNGREHTDCKLLQKAAFKYNLNRKKYDFKKSTTDKLMDPKTGQSTINTDDDFTDYVPNCPVNSAIINYEEFGRIWKFMPDYVKIRVPEIIY